MKTDEQKLNIVGAAAQLLLENGSETYRVEETARRMARGFGMEQVNIAAFPTSVFLEADGRACVRRISRRGTNSRRIAMVNEISREVEHGKLSAEQAERALERARSTPGFSQRVLIPAYALAAASFCLLFGGDAATFGVTVPAFGEGMRPFGPRTLPRRPTIPIISGEATTTSKSNQFSFVIFSTSSMPPT